MTNLLHYKEILSLADMLTGAGIPYEMHPLYDGWQLIYAPPREKPVSVIEHAYSYGGPLDQLEINGLLTQAEKKADAIMGFMTAEEVFERIHKHWRNVTDEQRDPAALPGS